MNRKVTPCPIQGPLTVSPPPWAPTKTAMGLDQSLGNGQSDAGTPVSSIQGGIDTAEAFEHVPACRLVASFTVAHPVADAADRTHIPRCAGLVAQLLAEVGDMDVDQVLVADPGVVPYGVDELAA